MMLQIGQSLSWKKVFVVYLKIYGSFKRNFGPRGNFYRYVKNAIKGTFMKDFLS